MFSSEGSILSFFIVVVITIGALLFLSIAYGIGMENVETKLKTGNPILIKDHLYKCEVLK